MRVLEIKGGFIVVINARGLYRVVVRNRPIAELLERRDAEAVAATYDETNNGPRARIMDYADAAQSSSSF